MVPTGETSLGLHPTADQPIKDILHNTCGQKHIMFWCSVALLQWEYMIQWFSSHRGTLILLPEYKAGIQSQLWQYVLALSKYNLQRHATNRLHFWTVGRTDSHGLPFAYCGEGGLAYYQSPSVVRGGDKLHSSAGKQLSPQRLWTRNPWADIHGLLLADVLLLASQDSLPQMCLANPLEYPITTHILLNILRNMRIIQISNLILNYLPS